MHSNIWLTFQTVLYMPSLFFCVVLVAILFRFGNCLFMFDFYPELLMLKSE